MTNPNRDSHEQPNPTAQEGWTKWMNEALVLATNATAQGEVPVGTVVISNNHVIGRGYNRRETLNDPLAHAELIAISEAARTINSWRLVGCTLFVTLEPCLMCLAACQQARIDQVIYGASDPKGGALSLGYRLNEDTRINHRFSTVHMHNDACGKILSDFFKKRRSE
jgi:tRNA(adenine34) deaminase